MKKRMIAGICCLLLIVGAVVLVRQNKMENTTAPAPTVALKRVNTAVAHTGELQRNRTCTASVEAWQQSDVAPRISASVTTMLVSEGDRVKKREVLVRLDARAQRTALNAAEARLHQTQAEHAALKAEVKADTLKVEFWRQELQRDQNLACAGAIPQAQADATAEQFSSVEGKLHSIQARLQAAQQVIQAAHMGVEQARIQLGYTQIRAPFNASVSKRHADSGDMALPGAPLLTLEDISRLKLVFTLPQNETTHVRLGQRIHILTSAAAATSAAPSSETHDIRIKRIHPATDPRTRSITLEAWGELPSSLRPGNFVPLKVNVENYTAATLIPRSALIPSKQQKDQHAYVYSVRGGNIELKNVILQGQNAEMAAVAGLEAGTEVVTHSLLGWNTLKSGDTVEVVK
jgi:RND family efflux transporter MFP subunit